MADSPFSPSAINKAVHDTVDQAIAALPAGKNNAVLIDGTASAQGGSARAMYIHRLNDHWQFAAEGDYNTDGQHHVAGKVATAIYW